MGLVSLQKDKEILDISVPEERPGEDTIKMLPFANQEESSYQKPPCWHPDLRFQMIHI